MQEIRFVTVQPPGPNSDFVECENERGESIAVGQWRKRDDGYWELVVRPSFSFRERADVLAFQQKFNVPMAKEPSFLDREAFNFRWKFMQEELNEFVTAHNEGDMHGAADALVDLAYVLHGTALMMGLPWPMLWSEVQRANMAKERATSASQSKRGTALDVIKPEGWKGPDHTAALGEGPWPTFQRAELREDLGESSVEFKRPDDSEGGLPE